MDDNVDVRLDTATSTERRLRRLLTKAFEIESWFSKKTLTAVVDVATTNRKGWNHLSDFRRRQRGTPPYPRV